MKHLQKILNYHKEQNKYVLALELFLHFILALMALIFLFVGNYKNLFFCILTALLMELLYIVQRLFSISFPPLVKAIVMLFVFVAEIGGEVFDLYVKFTWFDALLHTLCGFIAAGVGLGIFYMFAQKKGYEKLIIPTVAIMVSFCFSMTVSVFWEFFEFTADRMLGTDTQKDAIVSKLSSTIIDPSDTNTPVKIENIDKTVYYDQNGDVLLTVDGGYVETGIKDTIGDMFVNLIGSVAFQPFSLLYALNYKKYTFASKFFLTEKARKLPIDNSQS